MRLDDAMIGLQGSEAHAGGGGRGWSVGWSGGRGAREDNVSEWRVRLYRRGWGEGRVLRDIKLNHSVNHFPCIWRSTVNEW